MRAVLRLSLLLSLPAAWAQSSSSADFEGHVQNRVNYQDVNTTWGTTLEPGTTLGRFQAAGNPRQIQLGVKFDF